MDPKVSRGKLHTFFLVSTYGYGYGFGHGTDYGSYFGCGVGLGFGYGTLTTYKFSGYGTGYNSTFAIFKELNEA